MANTISLMSNAIRNVVSKKRIRYKEKGFNLDLTYIRSNIIAMGYPAPDKLEGIYRNRLEDVLKFLEENHADHYKIYNLCLERSYDVSRFHGRVAIYAFEDHNPPTIELIQRFCHDVHSWLRADERNVVAVHCKAGKGRTGTMICAYLLYSGFQTTADEALAWYDEKRTKDRKGVTIPSQRRYVQYFSNLMCSSVPYEKISLNVCQIRFDEASCLHNHGTVQCSVSVLQDSITDKLKPQRLKTWTLDFNKSFILDISNSSLTVSGDIKVELSSQRKIIFHFWFNTFFVRNSAVCEREGDSVKFLYTLNKSEIDDAHKDREHKSFSEDFKVCIVFEETSSEGVETEHALNNSNDKKRNVHDMGSDHETDENFEASGLSPPSSSQCLGALSKVGDSIFKTKSQSTELTGSLNKNQYEGFSSSPVVKNSMMTSKRKQSSTKSNLSNANNTSSKNDLKKQHMFNQPSVQNSSLIKSQNGSTIMYESTSDIEGINDRCNISRVTGGSNKCFDQESCITYKRSSLASIQGAGEDEEDWESGESSFTPLAPKAQLSFKPCSHSKVSSNIQTDDKLKDVTCLKSETIDKYKELLKDTFCPSQLVNLNDVTIKSNINEKLSDKTISESDRIKHSLLMRNSVRFDSCTPVSGRRNSFEWDNFKDFTTNTKKCNGIGGPGAKTLNSKQRLKMKFKKNKLKLSQKFQWLQNYFRSDPSNFCQNFVPSNAIFRNNGHIIAGRCEVSSTATSSISFSTLPIMHRLFSSCPNIFSKINVNHSMKIKSKSSNSLLKSQPKHKIFKNNSDDFYSYICDNQLSFNNSPCKSPRLFIGNSLENNTIQCKHLNQHLTRPTHGNYNVVIVSANPAKTNSIGFKIEAQSNCFSKEIDEMPNDKNLNNFPFLNEEFVNVDVDHNTTGALSEIFNLIDFNDAVIPYETQPKQKLHDQNISTIDKDF